jgi:tryptophan synthase beta subunit
MRCLAQGSAGISVETTLKDATNEDIRDWITTRTIRITSSERSWPSAPLPDMWHTCFKGNIDRGLRKTVHAKTGNELPTHVVACVVADQTRLVLLSFSLRRATRAKLCGGKTLVMASTQ